MNSPEVIQSHRPNDEKELTRLGFERHPEWDFKETGTESYRLVTEKAMYRAHVTRCNGPVYVNLGVIVDKDRGIVDRWRDCCSTGSVELKILFNENQCSLSLNTPESLNSRTAALEQVEAPALEVAPGVWDIAPEREEVQ